MPDRLFTLDEALLLLPVVKQLIAAIQAAKEELDDHSAELDQLLALTSGNGHLAADIASTREALQTSGERLQGLMTELDGLGVELKGIEEGLVDFPSEREGRVVYLCWRAGEETIEFWHEIEAGFAGRQRL
jgi:hypothetical protein